MPKRSHKIHPSSEKEKVLYLVRKKNCVHQAWWHIPIISALGKVSRRI
jgi:hypothetical protein